MSLLLNWRAWIALVLAALLSFSHFSAWRAGKANVRTAWQAATAAANIESQKIAQHRETVLGVAVKSAASRAVVNRADAARSGDALVGLRDAIHARRVAESAAGSANLRADTAEKLLIDCGRAYQELGERADRHVNDVQMLLDAWPK